MAEDQDIHRQVDKVSMRINDSMNHAFYGLQQGLDKAARAADDVVHSTIEGGDAQDTVEPLMKLKEAQREVEVNTQVAKASDEMLGTIIDVKA